MIVVKDVAYKYEVEFKESQGFPPDYEIKMPSQQLFLAGTCIAGENDRYYCTVTIPVKAPSSTSDTPWSITWKYGSIQKTTYFDVKDTNVSNDELYQKELLKFTIAGKDYRARLIIPESPETCDLSLYYKDKLAYKVENAVIEPHRLGTQITGTFPASYMVPGQHIVIWSTNITIYYQTLNIVPLKYLPVMSKVRFIIDRILKSIDEPQTYLDADIAASLAGGIDYINGVMPITNWDLNNYPEILQNFLVNASAWYMLNSQYMLESDLAFAYTDQKLSIDSDRTSPIESEISRLQEYLSEHLPPAKKKVFNAGWIGTLAVTKSPIGPTGMQINPARQLIRLHYRK